MAIVEDLIEAIHTGLSTSEDSISIHVVMDISREKEKAVISLDKSALQRPISGGLIPELSGNSR
jgi:hypothetical protein